MLKVMHSMPDPTLAFEEMRVHLDQFNLIVPRPTSLEDQAVLVLAVRSALHVDDVEFHNNYVAFECYPGEGFPVGSLQDAEYYAEKYIIPKVKEPLQSRSIVDYELEFWLHEIF